MKIVAGTGHRPDKITVENGKKSINAYDARVFNELMRFAEEVLIELSPDRVISGMALGWDQAIAKAAYNLDIPFIAAVPHAGQENVWPEPSRQYYRFLLTKADEVVTICPGPYSAKKMDIRNRWMVDHCTDLAALHNGSMGGTRNCIRYAQLSDPTTVTIHRLWTKWGKYSHDHDLCKLIK